MGLLRPAVALAELRLSATVGVGSSRPSWCSPGRWAAPTDIDVFDPSADAVGVGSSPFHGAVGSSNVGRLLV